MINSLIQEIYYKVFTTIVKQWIKEIILFLFVIAAILACVTTFFNYADENAKKHRLEIKKSWDEFDANMRAQGCWISGFQSEKRYIYDVWSCPTHKDLILGRAVR